MLVKRVPQPPVNAALRDPEHHDFWRGLGFILVAAVCVVMGMVRPTKVETTDGELATSFQLTKGFARGGIVVQEAVTAPNPAVYSDPQAMAEALKKMARERATSPRLKYRVNTGAVDPCPT